MSMLPNDYDTIPHGSPEMLRACIHEVACITAIQVELVMRYAELGDDRGLEYAIRNWAGYTRQAIDLLGDIKERQKGPLP